MSRRDVSEWSLRSWTFRTQHPSLVLRIVELSGAAKAELPVEAGCYVLMAPGIGRRYVGTAASLAERIVPSWRQNLPAATRVLCVTPSGLTWHEDQRLAIESLCIKRLDQCVNRSAGRRTVTIGTDADYMRAVAAEVACAVELACPVIGLAGAPRLSQGETARALVLAERRHPPSVRTLLETMRTLGWSATGHTPHRTLRRDLCDATRAGDRAGRIAIHGPWTNDDSLIYVVGRRYSSGWRAPMPAGSDPGHAA